MYRITWKTFDNSGLEAVDDPIGSGHLSIQSFISIYGTLLETLDGRDMSSYVDFYFERSVCNSSLLVFVDENAKLDFRDEAILMGLIPEMKEIMEGEPATDKKTRQNKDIQKQKLSKPTESWLEKQKKIVMSAQKSLDVLDQKLKQETDEGKKQKIQSKINKIIKILAESKHNSC